MTEKTNTVDVVVCEEPTLQTQYAGALAFNAAWDRFGVADILLSSGICYGKESDMAPDMALAHVKGLWSGPHQFAKRHSVLEEKRPMISWKKMNCCRICSTTPSRNVLSPDL